MRHPKSRSERRYAREVWRDKRRRTMMSWSGYSSGRRDPTENRMWVQSGKQCVAHGNRCACGKYKRIEQHRDVKRLRSEKFGPQDYMGWSSHLQCEDGSYGGGRKGKVVGV